MVKGLTPVVAFERAYAIFNGGKGQNTSTARSYFISGQTKSRVLEALYLIVRQQLPDQDPLVAMADTLNVRDQPQEWVPLPDTDLDEFDITAWIERVDRPAPVELDQAIVADVESGAEDEGDRDDEEDDEGDDDDQPSDGDEPGRLIEDHKGEGTGRFTNIPDSVVHDEIIFPPLTFNDLPEDKIDLRKPNPLIQDNKHNLDPDSYDLVKLDVPFDRVRPPYTTAEFGIKLNNDIWTKFGHTKNIHDPRNSLIPRIYYWMNADDTKNDAEARKFTHMYTHNRIGLHATWEGDSNWEGELLPFLLALSGFTQAEVDTMWGRDSNTGKPTRTFKNHEVMQSKNLELYFNESRAFGPDSQYTGSPTLMYSLLKYAHVNKIACRESKPRNALDILIMHELIANFNEINKALSDRTNPIDHSSIKEHIHYIQNIGFIASLIYEVVAGTSVQLTGWNQLIHLLLPKDELRVSQLRVQYGNAEGDQEDVGRATIGFYLIISKDKKSQKTQRSLDKELKGNQKPFIFNTTKMKSFSNKLVRLIIEDDKDAWKAAAICVEMHTGARITEVLGYAEFESFSQMQERDPDRARILLQSIREKTQNSYHLDGIENSIIQQGILKRKSNRIKAGKRTAVSFFDETLPPKPVIMDLTAFDIKKAIFKVRQHVYNYMSTKKLLADGQRLRDLPPPFFKPLTGQVNAYLRQIFVDGAIVGHQAHTEGKHKNRNKTVTTHILRRFYANYSFDHHAINMVRNVWIMTVLGHDAKGLATSLSYTNATMEDPLAHIPTLQKDTSIGVMAMNALQDIKDDFSNQFRDLIAGVAKPSTIPPRRPHSVIRKRKRNELDDDSTLVAVIKGPPVFIRRVMPARDESRTTTDREKADIVKAYVEENFRFEHEGQTYICKPTQAALISKCHFGHTYANAFVKLEKDMVKRMAQEYDDALSPVN